jgi:hypothetical protein
MQLEQSQYLNMIRPFLELVSFLQSNKLHETWLLFTELLNLRDLKSGIMSKDSQSIMSVKEEKSGGGDVPKSRCLIDLIHQSSLFLLAQPNQSLIPALATNGIK